MKTRLLFLLAVLGVLAGLTAAHFSGLHKQPLPPAFIPAANPYSDGIYANGIIESDQISGANINLYPEVSATVTGIPVTEGQQVRSGDPVLLLDDSIQRATTEQIAAQTQAARAQIAQAKASLKNAQDQLDKQRHSWQLDPESVSSDALDNARNAMLIARSALDVAKTQAVAQEKAWRAAQALLAKYTLRAPRDGKILAINTAIGSYVSSTQGVYDTYTQGYGPAIVLGAEQPYLDVRCYVDEILVNRLPAPASMRARMFVRGTSLSLPLEFVRIQPYVSPKIQLSDQRTERVDVRVLPVIFRFRKPTHPAIYPGQLVDVYIGTR